MYYCITSNDLEMTAYEWDDCLVLGVGFGFGSCRWTTMDILATWLAVGFACRFSHGVYTFDLIYVWYLSPRVFGTLCGMAVYRLELNDFSRL